MDITNKTQKPLTLPLPGGKRLFLGPGKTGQVSPEALEHPLLAELLKTGDIETAVRRPKHEERDGGKGEGTPSPRHGGPSPKGQFGDR